MSTNDRAKQRCCKCNAKSGGPLICSGCQQSFCLKHVTEHRQELSQQMDAIGQEHDLLRRDLSQSSTSSILFLQIDTWENEAMKKIQNIAEMTRIDLKQYMKESADRLSVLLKKISDELRLSRDSEEYTEDDLNRWAKQLEKLRKEMEKPSKIKLTEDVGSTLRLIKVIDQESNNNCIPKSSSDAVAHEEEKPYELVSTNGFTHNGYYPKPRAEVSTNIDVPSAAQPLPYLSIQFGLDHFKHPKIQQLFEQLISLPPMDKNGPMSGNCDLQTTQMEHFLSRTFGFTNIPPEYIVEGVNSFQVKRYPRDLPARTKIAFPSSARGSFVMTKEELLGWQRSYAVYVDRDMEGMTPDFLYRALQGLSQVGEEAFHMKLVVRISTCPILMGSDTKIIPRQLHEDWPHRIKLVSVTGIDFSGRKHDEWDILVYVKNWKDIFEVDPRTGDPMLKNERGFALKRNHPPAKLHEDLLLQDLKRMARLRLRACDKEKVEVVVETEIGLGVFSGAQIGIDRKVRMTSALAIRTVLEEDGPTYRHIRAVVFTLPRLNKSRSGELISGTFDTFDEQFHAPEYKGSIPVLIADQDMHRLTVAIARLGFTVSELNPSDSHGVFGEYWQNERPAMEEKLALTTVGLLVQHHLFNPSVLNPNNYHLI